MFEDKIIIKKVSYYFFFFMLGMLLSSMPFAVSDAQARSKGRVVEKIRIGQHGDMTRVVIESNRPIKPNYFTLPTPPRFVADFKNLTFKADTDEVKSKAGGLVKGIRQGLFKPKVTRMVVDLSDASVASVFSLPPLKKKNGTRSGYRLVIDLKKATNAQVAKRKAQLSKKKKATRAKSSKITRKKKTPSVRAYKRPQGSPIIVVIDPGHGGVDPGALARTKKVYEKDIVLKVAKKLQKELNKQAGVKVYLTRSKDIFVPLKKRVKIAQDKHADIFISLHADAHKNRKIRGGSIYVLSDGASDSEAARLARSANRGDLVAGMDLSHESNYVRDILIDLTQRETMNKSAMLAKDVLDNIGNVVKLRKKRILFAGFRVLKAPEIASVLIEMSYISNPRDERILRNSKHQAKLARNIARGVKKYIKEHMYN